MLPFAGMASIGLQTARFMDTNERTAKWTLHREGASCVVSFSGAWLRSQSRPSAETLVKAIESEGALEVVDFQADEITDWDTTLPILVRNICDHFDDRKVSIRINGLPDGVRNLIELSRAVAENTQTETQSTEDFLERVGKKGVDLYQGVDGYFSFIGQLFIDLGAFARGRGRLRRKDFLGLLQDTGGQAVPIVSLLSFLTGLIIAFIGVIQLQKFAADIYVADLVGLAVTRELGAVMAGVIMAGRTGAAFAARIGSMRVNQEIDALTTFGISPMQFLVLPRVLALMLMMPLLCACANFVAIIGGMVVAVAISDVSIIQYANQVQAAVGLNDLFVGIFKSGVFGLIIAVAGCYRGLNCGNDAGAVGQAATAAVVTGITWIVVADACFAVMFHLLGV